MRELSIHAPIIVLFGGGALISMHEQSGFFNLKKKSLRKRDGGQLVCLKAVYEIQWGMGTVLLLNK